MLKKAMPGAFKGSSILENEGELALLEKVLLPAFAAKGINSEEDVIRELGMILGNRTGSGLMSRIFQQRETLKKQVGANSSAQDIGQLDAAARNTLAGKEIELHAKWRDVLKELGTTVLPIAIKAVEGLTSVVKGIVGFAREFPTLTKWLTIGFGVLSGIVAAGGVMMMATAGFKALGLAMVVSKGVGIGSMLIQTAGGFGQVALALGAVWGAIQVIKLGAAAYELYKASHHEGVVLSAESQRRIAAGELNHPAPTVRTGPSDFMADRQARTANNSLVLNMDGRKVGEIVSGHQARAASRPQTGATSFDARLALGPAGGY